VIHPGASGGIELGDSCRLRLRNGAALRGDHAGAKPMLSPNCGE
jgi:hypothetical protein